MIYDSLNKQLPVNTHVYMGATEAETIGMKRQGLVDKVFYSAETGDTQISITCSDGVNRVFNHWMEKL